MIKLSQCLLVGLFVMSPLSVSAISVYPSDITMSPTPQTIYDSITAQVSGSYSSTGYTLNNSYLVSTTNNHFDIVFDVSAPDGPVLTVLVPFSYDFNLGALDAGNYSITANFYVNDFLDNTISNNFTVSPVPIPAAAWLFFSGMLSLVAVAKTSSQIS